MNRSLIGVLTPSSNTILEPATSAMVAKLANVSAHFSRFNVTRIALSDSANNQFRLEPMLTASRLLADAHVGVIAWSGTSASWLGSQWDLELCRAIEMETGIAACTAVGAINDLIQLRSATRIGLVSPYTDDVQDLIISNYAAAGIDVIAESHTGLSENFAFSQVTDASVAAMCRQVAKAGPEAIVIMCTNMRGWSFMADMEAELGMPVIDSTAAVVWKSLDMIGVDVTPLRRDGWMFAQRASGSG